MMGLRLVEGVDLADVARRTGLDPRVEHAETLARHVASGLARRSTGARLRLTARGLDLASYVTRSFLPDEPADARASSRRAVRHGLRRARKRPST